MGRITETVKILLIINVIFYVASNFLGLQVGNLIKANFIMFFPEDPYFKFWQPLTHMFMHGGSSHIIFNMFNLYMFGSFIENAIGKNKFLFVYFSAGFGALILHLVFDYMYFAPIFSDYIASGLSKPQAIEKMMLFDQMPGAMLGASGAVWGLMAAFVVLYPNLPLQLMFIPVPIKAKYLIGGYFLLDLYFAISRKSMFSGVSIAHWAHIGGAVVGFVIIWYWKKNSFNDKRWY